MSSYIVWTGDAGYAEYGNGWTTNDGWAPWGYRVASNPTRDHYVEYTFNVPSGYYDLYYYSLGGISQTQYSSRRIVTVLDGNNTNTERNFWMDMGIHKASENFPITTGTYGDYFYKFAMSVPCSGTMLVRQEVDYRETLGSNMFVTAMALNSTTDFYEVEEVAPSEYVPTSNRSKPHPLYSN